MSAPPRDMQICLAENAHYKFVQRSYFGKENAANPTLCFNYANKLKKKKKYNLKNFVFECFI